MLKVPESIPLTKVHENDFERCKVKLMFYSKLEIPQVNRCKQEGVGN